eukprot:scaffold19042_cov53-Attheya_sp.AAC.2
MAEDRGRLLNTFDCNGQECERSTAARGCCVGDLWLASFAGTNAGLSWSTTAGRRLGAAHDSYGTEYGISQ